MLYVSTACVSHNRIADTINEYANNGIKSIELSGGTDYYHTIEQDLISLQKQYQLTYVCHAYFPPHVNPIVVNLASCNDKIYKDSISHYEQCIDMLNKIKCNVLSIHAGFLVEVGAEEIGKKLSRTVIYEEKEAYERFAAAYQKIGEWCRQSDISFYLENNVLSLENYKEFGNQNYMMMTDYRLYKKMTEYIDFNLLLDVGHLYVSCNTLNLDFKDEFNKLKANAKWFHISDNNGIVDQHKPLQENSWVLDVLKDIKNLRDYDMTLETAGTVTNVIESMEKIEKIVL